MNKGVIDNYENRPQEVESMMFLDTPGGTGKTFVLKTILAYLRGNSKQVLATATSANSIRFATAHFET